MKKPKILLITCGGTIGMISNSDSLLQPKLHGNDILDRVPEARSIAHIDVFDLINIDSTNIQPHHWTTLALKIAEEYDNYDGFVVTHGTDTLAYTASALSFSLQNLGKPIVCTGAMKPFEKIPSDIYINLCNAIAVATLDLAEVCVVVGKKIIRAVRASKKSEMALDAFYSRIIDPIGSVEVEPLLKPSVQKRQTQKKLICRERFNPNIIYLKIIPGINPEFIMNDLKKIDGIILESTASGNVPHLENSFIPLIEKAYQLQKPVVITVHGYQGGVKINNYEPGFLAQQAGAISARDMTAEAATTKLMWVLANFDTFKDVVDIIPTNLVGEITNA